MYRKNPHVAFDATGVSTSSNSSPGVSMSAHARGSSTHAFSNDVELIGLNLTGVNCGNAGWPENSDAMPPINEMMRPTASSSTTTTPINPLINRVIVLLSAANAAAFSKNQFRSSTSTAPRTPTKKIDHASEMMRDMTVSEPTNMSASSSTTVPTYRAVRRTVPPTPLILFLGPGNSDL